MIATFALALTLGLGLACGPGHDKTLTDACITYYDVACDCGLETCEDGDAICTGLGSPGQAGAAEILAAWNCENAVLADTCDPREVALECRDEIEAAYEAQQDS